MLTGIMTKVTEQGQQMAKLGDQLNEAMSAKQETYAVEIMKTIRSRPGVEDHVGVSDGEDVTKMTHKKAPHDDESITSEGDERWVKTMSLPPRVPSSMHKSKLKGEEAQSKSHGSSRSKAEHEVSAKCKPK